MGPVLFLFCGLGSRSEVETRGLKKERVEGGDGEDGEKKEEKSQKSLTSRSQVMYLKWKRETCGLLYLEGSTCL